MLLIINALGARHAVCSGRRAGGEPLLKMHNSRHAAANNRFCFSWSLLTCTWGQVALALPGDQPNPITAPSLVLRNWLISHARRQMRTNCKTAAPFRRDTLRQVIILKWIFSGRKGLCGGALCAGYCGINFAKANRIKWPLKTSSPYSTMQKHSLAATMCLLKSLIFNEKARDYHFAHLGQDMGLSADIGLT
jgi:hypothetical protein